MRHRFQRQVMRAFEASVRLQSFDLAADELAMSTAELRDNVRTMERQLGVQLFEKGNAAVLTRAGQLMVPIVHGAIGITESVSTAHARMRVADMVLAGSVALLWGTGFIFAKAAIEQFPPIMLMCLRFAVTALALIWFVKPPPRETLPYIFLVAFISAAIQYSLTFTGLKSLDASIAIIVVQLEVPFGALIAALVLKDVLGWRRAFGMVLAFAGVALIAYEPRVKVDYTPMLLVVGGAFTWAIGQVMVKKLGPVGGFSLIAWVALFASPQLLVCSLLFESDQIQAFASATWVVWAAVAYLGLVMTALGYGLWYRLLGLYDVNQVMPFLLLLPGFTVAGSVLFLGESVSALVIIGGVVAVAGVGVITTARAPR